MKYSIDEKKNIFLDKFIYALGIRHIGLENAKLLSKHFGSFVKFKNFYVSNKHEDLLNIDGIGDTQVKSIKNFFLNNTNLTVLNELSKVLKINNPMIEKKNGILKNQTFLITGKLDGISRAEIKFLIEENSGTTISTVSKKLNYLIIGEKPTRKKVEIAKDLKIKMLDTSQFLKMLNKTG